jgi:hypothetical protein
MGTSPDSLWRSDTRGATVRHSLSSDPQHILVDIADRPAHMLQRLEAIRSKSPATVTQELSGLLLAYNLVRLEMERIADETGVAPTRISFVAALRLIINEWSWSTVTTSPAQFLVI